MINKTEYDEKVEEYINKISLNLFSSISSLALYNALGISIQELNDKSFGRFAFAIQKAMVNEVILSLTKIFEDRSGINISKLFRCINSNQRNINMCNPGIKALEKYKLFDFKDIEVYSKEVEDDSLGKYTYKAFTLSSFLKCIEKSYEVMLKEYNEDIRALKESRDKSIAHTDRQEIMNRTTWGKVEELIAWLEEYIDMMATVFTCSSHSSDGKQAYDSSRKDAQRASYSLLRLLEKANIIDDKSKYFDKVKKS
ncbi:MAG: hypothetical protein COB42_04060 [Sulfurimonas sp.]|nr:MAG: hypothetical protein COB42_04060 [Sulfurimonas sp.]